MMDGLPPGWQKVALADIAPDVRNGLSAKPADQPPGVPILRISAVRAGRVNLKDTRFHRDGEDDARPYLLRDRDLLFVRYNGNPDLTATCGMVRSLDADCVYPDKLIRVRVDESTALPEFVELVMGTEAAREQLRAHIKTAAGQHGISGRDLLRIRLPLPPLAEQRRIVARIEALFVRTRRARAELGRATPLLSRQKRAFLSSAFKGELTQDWRNFQGHVDVTEREGSWPIPASWSWKRVGEIGKVSLGRQRSPKDHEGPHMRPYVRAANVTWDGWDLSDVKQMNFAEPDFSRFRLEPGDILLNEGSGSAAEVGKPAIWHGEVESCCFQNTLLRVQPRECTVDYAYFYFLFSALAGKFVPETKGVNIHHIGKEGLSSFAIPVPPLPEQKQITERIQRMLDGLGRTATDQARSTALLDRLDAAILARAFRGELVPQDPADEPAQLPSLPTATRPRRSRAASPPAAHP